MPQQTSAATPTVSQLLNAANWEYQQEGRPADLRPFLVDGRQLSTVSTADGISAHAWLTPAGQVVISYQGTQFVSLTKFVENPAISFRQLVEDVGVASGSTTAGERDAAQFARDVVAAAQAQGIAAGDVFVTGHSLGGIQAQYAAQQTGLGGIGFESTGLPRSATSAGTGANFVNVVQYGDSVGNYSSDIRIEQPFAPTYAPGGTGALPHYGYVAMIGDPSVQFTLATGAQASNLGPVGVGVTTVAYGGNLAAFHLPSVQAYNLDVTLTQKPIGNLVGVRSGPVLDAAGFTIDQLIAATGASLSAPLPPDPAVSASSGPYAGQAATTLNEFGAVGGVLLGTDTTAPALTISGVSGATDRVGAHTVSGTVGTADAGIAVTVLDGATVLGSVASDAQGHWALSLPAAGDGPGHAYHLTALASDASGNLAISDRFSFALDFTPNQSLFGTVAHDVQSAAGQVVALYEGLLERMPDALGGAGWAQALGGGTSLHDVEVGILSSAEARTHLGAPDDAGFVEQLYETVLGRHGDAAGAQAWVGALAAGVSRADVAGSFVFSTENLAQLRPALDAGVFVVDAAASDVARLYHGLLERAPDAAGLQAWTAAAHGGTPLEQIAQAFLSSNEYAALHPGASTNVQYVEGLYGSALGRPADLAGEQAWVAALGHGASRANVAIGIVESAEAHGHLTGQIEAGWHLA